MEIVYKKEQATNVFQVELVYVINNKVKMAIMNEEEYGWKFDLNLPDGEYLYKCIINNGIRINDPNANKFVKWVNGETWSMLKIHNGNIVPRMYPKTEFANFRVHNGTTGLGCKSVTYPRDSRCYVSFELNNVCGVHSVTTLWYQPDGSLYHIEESTIDAGDNAYTNYAETFWVNLNQITHPFKYGIWMVEIYVDGEQKIREYFTVNQGIVQQKLINFVV